MTATVLISGKLFRQPERKTSGAGKPFVTCVTCVVKAGTGDAVTWWRVLSFSTSACDELATLHDGDGIAVSGDLKAELYERNGETKLSLNCFADRVISAKRQKRERAAEARTERGRVDPPAGNSRAAPDDEIPF